MEDFTLILQELVNKDPEKLNINLPENIVLEFEKTADNFLTKDRILEAIKVFAITKNIKKLSEIGNICLKDSKLEFAFKAFYYSKDKGGLNKVGEEFLKQSEIENAFQAFKLADNKEMTEFIIKNF